MSKVIEANFKASYGTSQECTEAHLQCMEVQMFSDIPGVPWTSPTAATIVQQVPKHFSPLSRHFCRTKNIKHAFSS